jgi:hypothetical protein
MPLTVSISQYELPSEGIQAAVLADIVDLGLVDSKYGKKHKVNFVYFLEEVDKEGRQKRVFERFNFTMGDKARLQKRLISLGVKIPADAKEFDIEVALGVQTSLVIGYSDGDGGKTYANVISVMKPKAGQSVQVPEDFQRSKDREPKA